MKAMPPCASDESPLVRVDPRCGKFFRVATDAPQCSVALIRPKETGDLEAPLN